MRAKGNVAPLIDTYVESGTLVVEDNKHYKSPSAEVVVTVRHIRGIKTTGSVAVAAEGSKVPDLTLSMGRSSVLLLKSVSVGKLRAAPGGPSSVSYHGNLIPILSTSAAATVKSLGGAPPKLR